MPSCKRNNSLSSSTSKVVYAALGVEITTDKKTSEALFSALSPEMTKNERFSFSLSTANEDNTVLLKFSSSDLVSLRAGMNTTLRLALSALLTIRSTSAGIELRD
jgi:tRNA threonylcarbamoyladenosine modification (KEOPS) complex  Pcc1 subunit